jgi:MATE family multidrug resistance protein
MMVTLPGPIIDLFLDDANPDRGAILAYGAVLLVWAAVFQIFDALQVIALGFLRGVQDIRVPMWLAAFSYWIVGMPASYLLAFPFGLGGIGIWLGLVIGLASASSLLMARFWRGRTRRVAV